MTMNLISTSPITGGLGWVVRVMVAAAGESDGAASGTEPLQATNKTDRPTANTTVNKSERIVMDLLWRVDHSVTLTTSINPPGSTLSFVVWCRMWQCNTHCPGSAATNSISYRSPGATLIVSLVNWADSGTGCPSVATTLNGKPCRCMGWMNCPITINLKRTRWPCLTSIVCVAGKALPLMVK